MSLFVLSDINECVGDYDFSQVMSLFVLSECVGDYTSLRSCRCLCCQISMSVLVTMTDINECVSLRSCRCLCCVVVCVVRYQ